MSPETPALAVPAPPSMRLERQESPQEAARRRRAEILAGFDGRPFVAEAAMARGLTRDDLRSRAARRLGRGVFVDAETP